MNTPRLLPWSSPEGKPCRLAGDGTGYVSRLADDMEAVQLRMGSELLGYAGQMLDDRKATTDELRFLGNRLRESLRDALRVAESRGERLPAPKGEGSAPSANGLSTHHFAEPVWFKDPEISRASR
ncbi:hypothetical protein ACQUSR_18080 [Streptomyces sp. P1-3]|uniref:hypothetical protein n=1 Tax=Streptomyces sp. P1-3 TaxID=3421658 RepID=UPI003D36D25C